jgi:hypothetical protein
MSDDDDIVTMLIYYRIGWAIERDFHQRKLEKRLKEMETQRNRILGVSNNNSASNDPADEMAKLETAQIHVSFVSKQVSCHNSFKVKSARLLSFAY